MNQEKLTYKIRSAIFEVSRHLGPGLYEECYQQALIYEMRSRGLKAEGKVKVPVFYKGVEIKNAYEADIIVEDKIILELKSVDNLQDLHFKQLNNYLHLTDLYIGSLVNFNCQFIEDNKSIFRVFNNDASNKEDL